MINTKRFMNAGLGATVACLSVIFLTTSSNDNPSTTQSGITNSNNVITPKNSASSSQISLTGIQNGMGANPFVACGGEGQVACNETSNTQNYPAAHIKVIDDNINQAIFYFAKSRNVNNSTNDKTYNLSMALRYFLDATYANNKNAKENKVTPYQTDINMPPELKDPNILVTLYCESLRTRLTELAQIMRQNIDINEKIGAGTLARNLIDDANTKLHAYLSSNNASGYNMWFDFKHDFVNNPQDNFPEVKTDYLAQLEGFQNYQNLSRQLIEWQFPTPKPQ